MRVIDTNGCPRWRRPRELDCSKWFWTGVALGALAVGVVIGCWLTAGGGAE